MPTESMVPSVHNPLLVGADAAREQALKVQNLSKVYDSPAGKVIALNRINFSISRGEFVSIVGPSGSGKSTLLNLIGALDRPTSGKVHIGGIDIFSQNDHRIAYMRNRLIGFIFQSYNLVNRMSVQKNVELPATISSMTPSKRKRLALKTLDVLGIADKANQKPSNLSDGSSAEAHQEFIRYASMSRTEMVSFVSDLNVRHGFTNEALQLHFDADGKFPRYGSDEIDICYACDQYEEIREQMLIEHERQRGQSPIRN